MGELLADVAVQLRRLTTEVDRHLPGVAAEDDVGRPGGLFSTR
ncbi:hypothetical protein BZL30_5185 [Mycobacterium kansasii]|uniref:Uncharacterized protein n=1 Tax=Mycobacterium kansasii TaxID=1768 RepID=A0A1V3X3A4_MYCKA|nr:hypothetical protein BZL30_5185 [Mycobacterium kansasii]